MRNSICKEPQYDEAKVREWQTIDGTEVKLTFNSESRLLADVVILIEKGELSKYTYSYKPMFHFFTFTREGKRFDAHMDLSNATIFAAALNEVTKARSINEYFFRSDVTKSWGIRADYAGKSIWRRTISKALYLEICPVIDERNIPSYSVKFMKDSGTQLFVLSVTEWEMLYDKIKGFCFMNPFYMQMYEYKILSNYMENQLSEISNLRNTMFEVSKQVNVLSASMDDFKSEVKNDIVGVVSSSVGTAMATLVNLIPKMTQNNNSESSPVVIPIKKVNDVVDDSGVVLSEKNDMDINYIPHANETSFFDDEPKIQEDLHSDYEDEERSSLFIDDTDKKRLTENVLKTKTMDEMIEYSFGKQVNPDELDIEKEHQAVVREKAVAKAKSLLASSPELLTAEQTVLVDYVHSRVQQCTVAELEEVTTFRPDQQKYLISIPSKDVTVKESVAPNEKKHTFIKQYPYDRITATIDPKITNYDKKKAYTVSEHALQSQKINKSMLFSSCMPGGSVGGIFSSIAITAGVFAAAYELIDNGADPTETSALCIRDLYTGNFKDLKFGRDRIPYYNKYTDAINHSVLGDENTGKKSIALDLMLLKGKYEYGYFELQFDTLTEKEQKYLTRALAEVYVLIWYATKENVHMDTLMDHHNVPAYNYVNKLMYRFARTMLVNMVQTTARTNKEYSVKLNSIIGAQIRLLDFFFDRFAIDRGQLKDALVTYAMFKNIAKEYAFGETMVKDEMDPDYINGTKIMCRLDYDQILANIERASDAK